MTQRMWWWTSGDAGGGYEKFILFRWGTLEISLLKLSEGDEMWEHQDKWPPYGTDHVFVWYFKRPQKGGRMYTRWHNLKFKFRKKFIYFMPSRIRHGITKVEVGRGMMLHVKLRTKKFY